MIPFLWHFLSLWIATLTATLRQSMHAMSTPSICPTDILIHAHKTSWIWRIMYELVQSISNCVQAKTQISMHKQAVLSASLQGTLWLDKDPKHLQADSCTKAG